MSGNEMQTIFHIININYTTSLFIYFIFTTNNNDNSNNNNNNNTAASPRIQAHPPAHGNYLEKFGEICYFLLWCGLAVKDLHVPELTGKFPTTLETGQKVETVLWRRLVPRLWATILH